MRKAVLCLMLAIGLLGCESKPKDTKPEADAGKATADAGAPVTTDMAAADPHANLDKPRTSFTLTVRPTSSPQDIADDVKKLEALLSKESGFTVNIRQPGSYKAVVDLLKKDEAQLSYFAAWPYLAGHMKADMTVIGASVVDGKTDYKSQWLTLANGKVKTLKDLKGKTVGFTSTTSAAGFLFPSAKLAEEGVVDTMKDDAGLKMEFAGSEKAALEGLLKKKYDAVAVSEHAPARDLKPAERSKLKVLSEQGPVPNSCIAIKSTLPEEARKKLEAAILKLNEGENKKLLQNVFGIDELKALEHYQYVDALQQASDSIELRYPL